MITAILMSLKDPRWGNQPDEKDEKVGSTGAKPHEQRGNDGPPDLEEVWRDLNQRLGSLFGRKSGGGDGGSSGGGSGGGSSALGGGIAMVLGIVFLIWAASGSYMVDASEKGVVLRFGKFKEVTAPGLNWHLPYPFESHEIVNVSQVRTVEVGYSSESGARDTHDGLMLTRGQNIVNIQFSVQYVLNDPAAFVFNNRDPEKSVLQAAETAMREIVGKNDVDTVLYQGSESIIKNSQQLIQKILDRYESGIQITQVNLKGAQPPQEVQEAFSDALKAGQDAERLKNEGQAYANDVVPKARGSAARLHEDAAGYAGRVVARAEGDASRFKQVLAEYSKAPEVTRNRMYIETMQQIYSSTSKVLLDAKSNGSMIYLPLDKIMQQSTGSQNGETTAKPAQAPEQAPRTDYSRDDRSRDRGDR